jgi:Flp pilus assembly pilin Flp
VGAVALRTVHGYVTKVGIWIASLIAVTIMTAVSTLGNKLSTTFSEVSSKLK